jgi:hypothetical protein
MLFMVPEALMKAIGEPIWEGAGLLILKALRKSIEYPTEGGAGVFTRLMVYATQTHKTH